MTEPCEFCLAEAGEPCAQDCVGYQPDEAQVEFSDLDPGDDEWGLPAPLEQSEAILMAAVHRLPFGGLVGVRGMGAPDRRYYDHGEWLHKLAEWMAEYQPIIRSHVDKLQDQARRQISLQIERDVLDGMIRRALDGANA